MLDCRISKSDSLCRSLAGLTAGLTVDYRTLGSLAGAVSGSLLSPKPRSGWCPVGFPLTNSKNKTKSGPRTLGSLAGAVSGSLLSPKPRSGWCPVGFPLTNSKNKTKSGANMDLVARRRTPAPRMTGGGHKRRTERFLSSPSGRISPFAPLSYAGPAVAQWRGARQQLDVLSLKLLFCANQPFPNISHFAARLGALAPEIGESCASRVASLQAPSSLVPFGRGWAPSRVFAGTPICPSVQGCTHQFGGYPFESRKRGGCKPICPIPAPTRWGGDLRSVPKLASPISEADRPQEAFGGQKKKPHRIPGSRNMIPSYVSPLPAMA